MEDDLQRMESLARDDAQQREEEDTERQHNEWATSARPVELCSTSELMEVFTEFYEGDKQDMKESDTVVSNSSIDTSVDIHATEFDLEFEGASATEFNLPNLDFGNNTESFNVEDLL